MQQYSYESDTDRAYARTWNGVKQKVDAYASCAHAAALRMRMQVIEDASLRFNLRCMISYFATTTSSLIHDCSSIPNPDEPVRVRDGPASWLLSIEPPNPFFEREAVGLRLMEFSRR